MLKIEYWTACVLAKWLMVEMHTMLDMSKDFSNKFLFVILRVYDFGFFVVYFIMTGRWSIKISSSFKSYSIADIDLLWYTWSIALSGFVPFSTCDLPDMCSHEADATTVTPRHPTHVYPTPRKNQKIMRFFWGEKTQVWMMPNCTF